VPLIEMTGQNENRHLLSRSYHLDLLDQYTGVWKLRTEFSQRFHEFSERRTELERLLRENQTQAQRLDFLLYQRDEIRALKLRPGEEDELENETKRLKYSARLGEFIQQAENILYVDDESVTS